MKLILVSVTIKPMEKKDLPEYKPSEIEPKWQQSWEKDGVYEPDMENAFKPFFNLMMFPYPSAEGMHIGNMYAFTGADIYGRFKRMSGFDVFEPIGLDGFGIHSENFALKLGEHPKKVAARTEANFYRQLKVSGNGYSWKHILETYDPDYYKWTQWLFIKLFEKGLAYKAPAPVNFCPSCKTVLADEQVIDGRCERCSTQVEIRKLEQWFFKITAYANQLLSNLKKLNWPAKVLLGQKNWIGQSTGAEVVFKVENKDIPIHVFTTRVDTVYGVTALIIASDKIGKDGKTPFALELAIPDYKDKVTEYIKNNQKASGKNKRQKIEVEKTGVFTGAYAINPISGEKVPIWVANYVVGWYGTGALMVVPAHDERDFEFAKKYKIPVRPVIKVKNYAKAFVINDSVNQGFKEDLRNLKIKTTISTKGHYLIELSSTQIDSFIAMVKKYLKHNFWVEIVGERTVFIFGTGEVIEIKSLEDEEKVFEKCKIMEESISGAFDIWDMLTDNQWYKDIITTTEYGVLINSGEYTGLSSEEAIPRMTAYLVDINQGKKQTQYKLRDWIISRQRYWGAPIPMIYCENCGWQSVLEDQLPVLLPEVKDWKPKGTGVSPLASVDDFVYTDCPKCGMEAKRETDVCDTFLDSSWYFLRYPSTEFGDTPFQKARTKKWLPVSQYIGGAEHTVLHLLYSRFVTMALCDLGYLGFDEPFPNFYAHGLIIKDGAKMSKSRGNVVVPDEYIKKYGVDSLRCYLMFLGPFDAGGDFRDTGMHGMFRFLTRVWRLTNSPKKVGEQTSNDLKVLLHKTIKKVTSEISKFKYNTSIASLMEFINLWEEKEKLLSKENIASFIKLLAPFAPHLAEEVFHNLGYNTTIHKEKWPSYDSGLLVEDKVTVVVQINGKLRAQIQIPQDLIHEREQVIELALANETVMKYVKDELQPKKIFYVPGRLINFVI